MLDIPAKSRHACPEADPTSAAAKRCRDKAPYPYQSMVDGSPQGGDCPGTVTGGRPDVDNARLEVIDSPTGASM